MANSSDLVSWFTVANGQQQVVEYVDPSVPGNSCTPCDARNGWNFCVICTTDGAELAMSVVNCAKYNVCGNT